MAYIFVQFNLCCTRVHWAGSQVWFENVGTNLVLLSAKADFNDVAYIFCSSQSLFSTGWWQIKPGTHQLFSLSFG